MSRLTLLPLTLLSLSVTFAQPQNIGGGQPMVRLPRHNYAAVPVPPDPNEPVTGVVQTLASQAERSTALALLDRARQGQQLHMRGMPPFQLVANFAGTSGSGNLTETWMNGQKWQWTGTVGDIKAVRIGGDGLHLALPKGGAIPPAVHILRNAIFWAGDGAPGGGLLRSSNIIWNGKPTTCLLFSGNPNADLTGGRSWDEEEYCMDDASGLLQVHSIVPGTFVDYSYAGPAFHNRHLPSQIAIFSGGSKVMDAQVTMNDAGTPDESLFTATEEMKTYGPVGTGTLPSHGMMDYPSPNVSGVTKPVIVHLSIDGQGMVVASEVSIASDPSLVQTALDLLKKMPFPPNGNTRQMYMQVRFVPQM